MAANLFHLDSIFFSFSAFFTVYVPLVFISDPPGSNPKVQPLKIGGWHIFLLIRHLGAMLGFKRGLIITTLYRHFLKCSGFNMFFEQVEVRLVLYTGKLDIQGNLSLCSVKRNVKSY